MIHDTRENPSAAVLSESLQLTGAQRKKLRGLAHDLEPVVVLGRGGLTEGVLAEIERALECHELIKVRLSGDRNERSECATEIASRLRCGLAGTIGTLAILYRPHPNTERRRLRV
jgi:RNA-binding protein